MPGGDPFVNDERFYERALSLVLLATLIFACLQIAAPFLAAVLWGIALSVATWPLYARLSRSLGDRGRFAAVVMVLLLVLVFVVPLAMVVSSLADGVAAVSALARDLTAVGVPPPPEWLRNVPVAGTGLYEGWEEVASDLPRVSQQLRPYIGPVATWLLARGAALGLAVFELLLAVVVAGILFVRGEEGADLLRRIAGRLGGAESTALVDLAGRTIRSVANGIVGTAVVQALLALLGFWAAAVPGANLLALAVFMASVLQLPVIVVTVPVGVWALYRATGWGLFLLLWGVLVVGTVDNFLRPYLISHGSRLPLMLIFVGVMGGLLAYGFLGLFLGPVILAAGWTLLEAWLREPRAAGDGELVAPDQS